MDASYYKALRPWASRLPVVPVYREERWSPTTICTAVGDQTFYTASPLEPCEIADAAGVGDLWASREAWLARVLRAKNTPMTSLHDLVRLEADAADCWYTCGVLPDGQALSVWLAWLLTHGLCAMCATAVTQRRVALRGGRQRYECVACGARRARRNAARRARSGER